MHMYILVNIHVDVHVGWADSVATNEVCVVCICHPISVSALAKLASAPGFP